MTAIPSVVRFAPRSIIEEVGQYKEINVEADNFTDAEISARKALEPGEWVWLSTRVDPT